MASSPFLLFAFAWMSLPIVFLPLWVILFQGFSWSVWLCDLTWNSCLRPFLFAGIIDVWYELYHRYVILSSSVTSFKKVLHFSSLYFLRIIYMFLHIWKSWFNLNHYNNLNHHNWYFIPCLECIHWPFTEQSYYYKPSLPQTCSFPSLSDWIIYFVVLFPSTTKLLGSSPNFSALGRCGHLTLSE